MKKSPKKIVNRVKKQMVEDKEIVSSMDTKSKSKPKDKMKKVIEEFEHKKLHSGSKKGPVVKKKDQALAIGYSEARKARKKKK